MQSIILVGLGGALGAISRYLVYLSFLGLKLSSFPYATLFVNVLGSGLLGAFVASSPSESLRLFIGIGLFGGFTTFSSFSLESIELLEQGRTLHALCYILLNLVLALGAFFFGRLFFSS